MKVTILVDNVSHNGIPGEWGFSAYIEHKGKHILLDTGASDLFLENAKKLGLSIADVDYAVLSHAHYDHSNGLACFFEHNGHAKFFLQEGAKENCYFKKFILKKYIGLQKRSRNNTRTGSNMYLDFIIFAKMPVYFPIPLPDWKRSEKENPCIKKPPGAGGLIISAMSKI